MHDEDTPPEGPRDPLISVEEAAAIIGRSAITLNRYRCDGRGPPPVRLDGGRIAYRRTEVLEWLAGQPSADPDLVDSKGAAGILGYSEKHLQNLRCCGGGPPFVRMKGQHGRTAVYYRREDVIAWRDAR